MNIKIDTRALTNKLKIFPYLIAKNMFMSFLGLLLLALMTASLIFYQYAFSGNTSSTTISTNQLRFQQQTLEFIVNEWDVRAARSQQADLNVYRNIFATPASTLEETEEEGEEELTEL